VDRSSDALHSVAIVFNVFQRLMESGTPAPLSHSSGQMMLGVEARGYLLLQSASYLLRNSDCCLKLLGSFTFCYSSAVTHTCAHRGYASKAKDAVRDNSDCDYTLSHQSSALIKMLGFQTPAPPHLSPLPSLGPTGTQFPAWPTGVPTSATRYRV
jgi:hypothetical protein